MDVRDKERVKRIGKISVEILTKMQCSDIYIINKNDWLRRSKTVYKYTIPYSDLLKFY